MHFSSIEYSDLNSRQKENYNYAKASALLANYGFHTLRLTDDWQGADFIAQHIDGVNFLLVQLKGRLYVDTKYKKKGIWICFFHRTKTQCQCYLYPHDKFLEWALENLNIGNMAGWRYTKNFAKVQGAYGWRGVPRHIEKWLDEYRL